MAKLSKVFRGLSMVCVVALAASITMGVVMEQYPSSLDTYFGTLSSQVVSEETSEADWIYQSNYTTAAAAIEGYKEFAIKEALESFVLLKNQDDALPLSSSELNVTLLGLRSYAAIYGNNGGSTPDTATVEENTIYDSFEDEGFTLNPTMLSTYASYCSTLTWAPSSYGSSSPSYKELNVTNDIPELSLSELAGINANYAQENDAYNTAIVVVGRPGGESYNYYSGTDGLSGMDSSNYPDSGNIMGLSQEEEEIINYAKNNFDKVIVLVNSTQQMEIDDLKNDDGIDAIMWIGYPGAYGFHAVAQVLKGEASPSGHLGDVYAANTAVNPAMMNFGDETSWENTTGLESANVNSYLIEAEGIYTGYRYYETRYSDVVTGSGSTSASAASAGTYIDDNGDVATSAGTWKYSNEVSYTFGYGLSYTTFEQTIDSVTVYGNKETAEVTVTVTNTGSVAGKSVIQLYAQTPYTSYDIQYNVEKSAIQLMDYEKTNELKAGESQTITMTVDLSNLASYDYTHAKTYILDYGTYYFAIGDDAHDALNNVLAAQGYTTADGMTENGDADKTYSWDWDGAEGDVDSKTFSTSSTGTEITNQLSEGAYATDYNAFESGTVTYLSRNDWDGTWPETYSGLKADATETLYTQLSNDFYELKTDDDTSEYVWGSTETSYTLNDMKGADWDDSRWDDIVDQVTIDEFLTFAQNAFHNVQGIESVGYAGNNADDGPGGSDSHYFNEGTYQGVAYEDADDYADYGTRVSPSCTNLAYTFNKELAYENGEIILGETSLIMELVIMIGPAMNLHRHAYNGRGGEYYSEDPILSGYTGSAVVQGAQSKGCLVNLKHLAFNDQEINRSGVSVFMNEQKAREMELRNFQQAIEGNGKPASFVADDETYGDTYTTGALGIMTSYNRIGATASSANYAVMQTILREEWGFKGYNVTDFTSVSLRAAPKESILCGTTAFCGFGVSVSYWSASNFENDASECAAIKTNIKYILYSLANSNAVNGTNNTTHRVQLMSTWRKIYYGCEIGTGIALGVCVLAYAATEIIPLVRKKREA